MNTLLIGLTIQTKGLTLEEISGKFNDNVEITFEEAITRDLEGEKPDDASKDTTQDTVQAV